MKNFSWLSIVFLALGAVLFVLKEKIPAPYEVNVLADFICLTAGALSSLIAIGKNENGRLKYAAAVSFFILLFVITWFDPFQLIRMLTWIKNGMIITNG